LALAFSRTAAADTFAVVRPHAPANGGGTGAIAFVGGPGTTAYASGPAGPMSFAGLRSIWQAAGNTYGIPWEVLAAINKVESDFGRNLGPSSAGAIGWMQFMPSTWARWGVDANGDGIADPNNPFDAIFSAARYLAACGGQTDIAGAIYCYNHADWYVNEVLGLAEFFSQGGGSGFFSFGELQAQVDTAQAQVTAAHRELVSALARSEALARGERRLLRQASKARLLSNQLATQKSAVLLGVRHDALEARIARLRNMLDAATSRLSNFRDQMSAGESLSGPISAGSFAGLQLGRIDQGVDISSDRPYPALAAGTVVHVDPNFWQGTPAVYEKLDVPIVVGGRSYDEIYYSETQALVHEGQRLVAGEPVIAPGSAEIGFARKDLPAAHGAYHEGQATAAGLDFYTYLTAGSPGGGSAPSLFYLLSSPLQNIQPSSGGAMAFTPTGAAVAFTPNVVYFTH
jgi:hypothetical protein